MCDVLSAQCARPPRPPLGGGGETNKAPRGEEGGRVSQTRRDADDRGRMRAKFIGQEMNGRGRDREGGGDEKEREKLRSNFCGGWEGGRGGEVCRDRIFLFLPLKRR